MVCLSAVSFGLVACGQRGALYLPTDPAATQRATLPQLIGVSDGLAAPKPAATSSAPASAAAGGTTTTTPAQK